MFEVTRKTLRRRRLVIVAVLALAALTLVLSWNDPQPAPTLLVALASAGEEFEAADRGIGGRAIARVEISGQPGRPRLIVEGFFETGTPKVSYDGHRALFAGRRTAGGPTEIWEVAVAGSSPRIVVRGGECLDPCYLPDGRLVYARSLSDAGSSAPMALYTSLADDTQKRRITFGNARDRSPAVLPDGRIVFRRHALEERGHGRLFTVKPDGTGLQLFCEPAEGASIAGGPWLVEDRLVFAEKMPHGSGQRLVSVSTRQPAGERQVLAGDERLSDSGEEWFSSVCKLPQGGLAASAWAKSRGWALVFPGGIASEEQLLSAVSLPGREKSFHPIGLVTAAPRPKPPSLTSVVDERKSTGTLLCLDVYASRLPAVAGAKRGTIRTVRVLTSEGLLLGEAPVEADGSFFIEVPADRPLRLELHGPDGVLARDNSGFWVRPNENRGCIGCHEDPELAPENRMVLSLARSATPVVGTGGRSLTR